MAAVSPSRLRRLRGVLVVAATLLRTRFERTDRRRILLSVCGVALAVAIVVVVAGISVSLASQGTVVNSNVDYWIVPESGDTGSLPVSVNTPQFADVHPVAERLTTDDRIQYASPVSLTLTQLSQSNTTEYVLLAGVIPYSGLEIAGVNTSTLTPGDPHYANGTYEGDWTGEAVLSDGAATLLNASTGTTLTASGRNETRSFDVTTVTDGGDTGLGSLPIAVVHLSELQTLRGTQTADTANQFLVATNTVGVRDRLETVYPNARVITRGSGTLTGLSNSRLALAVAVTGLLIAVVLGTLFVATAMGLEITADRRLWATLLVLGFSRSSRALLVAAQTLGITLLGGGIGVILGRAVIAVANTTAPQVIPVSTVATFRPVFTVYALGVAILIGLCSVPYLLWLTARGEPTDQLTA